MPQALGSHTWLCLKKHHPSPGGGGPGEKWKGHWVESGHWGPLAGPSADAREVFQAFNRLHYLYSTDDRTGLVPSSAATR